MREREYPATALYSCSEKDNVMTCNITFLSRLALSGVITLAVMTTGIAGFAQETSDFAQETAGFAQETAGFAQETYSGFDIGDCPDELLKRVWIEEHPLQAAAVEKEIIVLCTERAEAISAFLNTRIAQDVLLAKIWAEEPISESAPVSQSILQASAPDSAPDSIPDDQVELLRVEVENLKTRIASLEGQPVNPETEVRLEDLHAELAHAENRLKSAENENIEAIRNQSEDITTTGEARISEYENPVYMIEDIRDNAGNTELNNISPVSLNVNAGDSAGEFLIEQIQETVDSEPKKDIKRHMTAGEVRAAFEPIVAMLNPLLPKTANAMVPPAKIPQIMPERPARWEMLYATRAGNGPWKVSLQATRQNAITIPSTDPNMPATIQWETVVDAPEILDLNESLSDGRILLEVTDRGVLLGTESGDDGAIDFISFRPDSSPGILEWKVEKESENS